MNEHSFMDEDKLADIETWAIEGTAKRSGMDEEFVGQVVQDYTELIENLERYISERYANGNINTQAYILKEMSKKAAKDIAEKHDVDEDVVNEIIQDYTEIIRDALERETPDCSD